MPVAAIILFSGSVQAAAISWDNESADKLWSTSTNWNPDGTAATNDVTFGETGKGATGTPTNIVDASLSINSLSYLNTGAAATNTHTTQINSDQTLTVSGTGSAVQVSTSLAATSTNAVITGLGAFAVTGGTTANFNLGTTAIASGNGTQALDMSGLASFSANVGAFAIGTGQRNAGAVTLGASNSITATSLSLGGNATTGGLQSSLNLGQANTINADTINVGNGRSGGLLQFRTSGVTNPTATFANRAGTGAANLYIGLLDTNASGGPTSTVDFSGGTLNNAQFGTIQIGRGANGTAGGSSNASFTFGAGSMSATNIVLGLANTGSSTSSTGIGNFTMTAGAGTLTATTVTVGNSTQNNNTARVNRATGTFTQNGGTAAITTLIIGDRQNTSVDGNVSGTYNLAAGTLKAQTIQAGNNGTGGGTATRAFNWTGGTIQNLNSTTDLTIASTNGLSLNLSGVSTQKFTADTGRNIAVNAVMTGSGGFTKDGLGTLTLSGVNNYNGTTTISDGKLALTGTGSISNSPNIIVGASTTFDVSGVTGGYTLASNQTLSGPGTVVGAASIAGTLSPGSSPGTLNTGSQVWLNGGDYNWQIRDAAGVAGIGYDTIAITGTLDLASLTTGNFGINLWSLSSIGPDVNGDASNFNSLVDQSWTLLTTSGGITGFDANNFTISVGANNGAGGFSNTLDPEHGFLIAQSGNSLVLTYAVIPEPNAAMLLGGFGVIALLRRRRA